MAVGLAQTRALVEEALAQAPDELTAVGRLEVAVAAHLSVVGHVGEAGARIAAVPGAEARSVTGR